jgi:hypothetical protein
MAAARATTVPPIVHSVLRSAGTPLDAPTRVWFERRFARDFSNVRIHADERAAESARALNAVAYASGPDIVFGAGQYSTQSEHGRRLLAHELTHVVQQRAREVPGGVTDPGDAAEREAEWNADHVASGPLTFDARPHIVSRQTAPGNPSPAPGVCTPEHRQKLVPARTTSRAWLRTAVDALDAYIADPDSPATAATRASLVTHFHSPALGVASHVRTNIQSILDDIEELIEADRPDEGFRRFPAHSTECRPAGDPECDATAFVLGSRMVFCAPFFTHPSDRYRAGVLIHEVAHTLVGLDIEDRAYRGDRLLEFLTPAEAVNNAESYEMFVRELGTGRAVEGKPPRDEVDDCAPDVKRQIREALGRAQRWNGDAEEEAADERAVAIRINRPIFTRHLGDAAARTRAAAARTFKRTESRLGSAINVVCDKGAAEGCSPTRRAYGKKAENNRGLGAGIGAGIGGAIGLGVGLGLGFGLAVSLGGPLAALVGAGVGLGIALLGTIVGLIAGAVTSHGPSVHVCPNWTALPPLSRAESILAGVYEAFADLTPDESRKHAALAHALHDSAIGPPPAI